MENKAVDHEWQHDQIACQTDSQQYQGQFRIGLAGAGHVGHNNPYRRNEPAWYHMVQLPVFRPVPDEKGQYDKVYGNGTEPEDFSR